jgi:hypothetical protein
MILRRRKFNPLFFIPGAVLGQTIYYSSNHSIKLFLEVLSGSLLGTIVLFFVYLKMSDWMYQIYLQTVDLLHSVLKGRKK